MLLYIHFHEIKQWSLALGWIILSALCNTNKYFPIRSQFQPHEVRKLIYLESLLSGFLNSTMNVSCFYLFWSFKYNLKLIKFWWKIKVLISSSSYAFINAVFLFKSLCLVHLNDHLYSSVFHHFESYYHNVAF